MNKKNIHKTKVMSKKATKNNKRPKESKITESYATQIVFWYIRKNFNSKIIDFHEEENNIFSLFKQNDKSQIELSETKIQEINKYYKYILDHAKKNLKKDKYISQIKKTKFNCHIPEPQQLTHMNCNALGWNIENSISSIYDFIHDNQYVIPSFQRTTAWDKKSNYVELAYSIYNSVPLGLMYFWKITPDEAIKIKHYQIKHNVKQKEEFNYREIQASNIKKTTKSSYICSIIDGQQRATGINVIIGGTFNNMCLYFNEHKVGSKIFEFKPEGEYYKWTKFSNIYSKLKVIHKTTKQNEEIKKLSDELYISEISLKKLYFGFFKSKLISIGEILGANQDEIINIFIRTNSYGKKLNPTDILLSSLIGKFKPQIRNWTERLTKTIRSYKKDFKFGSVLKLINVYFFNTSKINKKDFGDNNKVNNKKEWDTLIKGIEETIKLIGPQGINFDSETINSDNSLIPIIIWITNYSNTKKHNNKTKENIERYLFFAQLLKYFSSSTDDKINSIIENTKNSEDFSGYNKSGKWNITKDNIINILNNYQYSTNKREIKLILNLNPQSFYDNTIEHIIPQSKGGSNKLWNLALLPKEHNEIIQNKQLDKKIEILSERLNEPSNIIMERLLLDDNWNIEESKRIDRIYGLIRDYFSLQN